LQQPEIAGEAVMRTEKEVGRDRMRAAMMNGYSKRLNCNPPSGSAKSALEINLLNKEEICWVKSSHFIPRLTPDKEDGSSCPVDIGSACVGEAREVCEPPPHARDVMKENRTAEQSREGWEAVRRWLQRSVLVNETGGYSSHRSVVVEYGAELSKGSAMEVCVCVDREDISSWAEECGPIVDGRSVAEICPYLSDLNGWPTCADVMRRAVAGAIIHDRDGYVRTVLGQQTRDTRVKPPLAVIARNNCRDESVRCRFDDSL